MLLVFAVVALSGPGRIDIVDGQTRFEVARSLVEHGDSIIRDERVWFWVLPGRDGERYTTYRFPQSLFGVPAILLADTVGPVSEGRRHFFFSLIGAAACAVLAMTFTLWFRQLGLSPRSALGWASLGIFATPCWFYGTSTFDDILGTTTVVLAVAVAAMSRQSWPVAGSIAAGLLLGLAFNCKEPLAIFVLPALAAHYDRALPLRRQLGRISLMLGGLAFGILAYKAYDLYKFPPGSTANHAEELKKYCLPWPGNFVAGVFGLTLSPGAGVLWYCPPLILSCIGLARWWRTERGFCRAMVVACLIFCGFIASISHFSGDPTWGPRYQTPMFALLWVFAPAGAARLVPRISRLVLMAGVAVQLLGLSVDPHRLYIERGLPSSFFQPCPWLYFHPAVAHILNRPREIKEILGADPRSAEAFTPSPSPTFAFPIIHPIDTTPPESVQQFHILNSLRPWWVSQWYLAPGDRPVSLIGALTVLIGILGLGVFLLDRSLRVLAEHPFDCGLSECGTSTGWGSPSSVSSASERESKPAFAVGPVS
jgi:hypothetical protein